MKPTKLAARPGLPQPCYDNPGAMLVAWKGSRLPRGKPDEGAIKFFSIFRFIPVKPQNQLLSASDTRNHAYGFTELVN